MSKHRVVVVLLQDQYQEEYREMATHIIYCETTSKRPVECQCDDVGKRLKCKQHLFVNAVKCCSHTQNSVVCLFVCFFDINSRD